MGNHEIKVSIVTVCYNAFNSIGKTIESIQNQTYTNIEYIIIDGASTDGTKDIIDKYSQYITYFVSEPDKGISDAFNKGISLASGQLIGLLNADDYYNPETVELVVKKYIETGCPDKTIFHGNLKVMHPKLTEVYKPESLSRFKFELPVWHPTVFVTKDVYEKYQYNLDYKIAMDYELLSRAYANKYCFVAIPAVLNNMFGGGVSNTAAIKGFKEVKRASLKNLDIDTLTANFWFTYRVVLYRLMMIKRTLLR